jgi:hypothetical protein
VGGGHSSGADGCEARCRMRSAKVRRVRSGARRVERCTWTRGGPRLQHGFNVHEQRSSWRRRWKEPWSLRTDGGHGSDMGNDTLSAGGGDRSKGGMTPEGERGHVRDGLHGTNETSERRYAQCSELAELWATVYYFCESFLLPWVLEASVKVQHARRASASPPARLAIDSFSRRLFALLAHPIPTCILPPNHGHRLTPS